MENNIETYVIGLGMMLSDVRIDTKGLLYILVEEKSPRADASYKEIGIPDEYQTFGNVEIIRQFMESIKDVEDRDTCGHQCTSNCRREGCNCLCGEYHCDVCHGTGMIEETVWPDEGHDYTVEKKCPKCSED